MMQLSALVAVLPLLAAPAQASPFKRWITAAPNAAATTSDVFPPTGTSYDSADFPRESAVGFPGITATGIEPNAIQTAPAYPDTESVPANEFPLSRVNAKGNFGNDGIDIKRYWGNLAPWYSVPSSDYGLPAETTPLIPEGYTITQVHYLYRHGARYPTASPPSPPAAFATFLHNITTQKTANTSDGTWSAWGELSFLPTWEFGLGSDVLTPFGRAQNFLLGVEARQLYGKLLNNFTEAGTIPVFRTQSQDRMVKTANNFAAGMFGVPEYLTQVNIEIVVENPGVNNSGADYEVCTNSNVPARGSIGSALATKFIQTAFEDTRARLNSQIDGITLTPTNIVQMLNLCAYETDALGYSAFCPLFTEQDWQNFEYSFDISFYYNNGFGSPVAAVQGKAYLLEFLARFTHQAPPQGTSALNGTQDSNPVLFPLNQSIYADATHEVIVLDALTALNLTALGSAPDPTKYTDPAGRFVASKTVPFGTHLVIQKLNHPTRGDVMRFIVNDAVVPLTYQGCAYDKDGLCEFNTVVAALQQRAKDIDYNYGCFGNFTAAAPGNVNGLPPAH